MGENETINESGASRIAYQDNDALAVSRAARAAVRAAPCASSHHLEQWCCAPRARRIVAGAAPLI